MADLHSQSVCSHPEQAERRVCIDLSTFFFLSTFCISVSDLCWGNAMVAYAKLQPKKKEESERLTGKGDKMRRKTLFSQDGPKLTVPSFHHLPLACLLTFGSQLWKIHFKLIASCSNVNPDKKFQMSSVFLKATKNLDIKSSISRIMIEKCKEGFPSICINKIINKQKGDKQTSLLQTEG